MSHLFFCWNIILIFFSYYKCIGWFTIYEFHFRILNDHYKAFMLEEIIGSYRSQAHWHKITHIINWEEAPFQFGQVMPPLAPVFL